MGYDLHITRRGDGSAEDGPAITLDEWLAYVEADPELRHDGYAQATLSQGQVLRIEQPGLVVWTAYSRDAPDDHAWFSHDGHGVVVKDPDVEVRRKMAAVARHLGAEVQGDEGEVYGADGLAQDEPPAGPTPRRFGFRRR